MRQLKNKQYSDIVKHCSDEIKLPSTSQLAEALLLRATFYLLRGETNCAMEDFEQLLILEGVDKRVSKCICLVCQSVLVDTRPEPKSGDHGGGIGNFRSFLCYCAISMYAERYS